MYIPPKSNIQIFACMVSKNLGRASEEAQIWHTNWSIWYLFLAVRIALEGGAQTSWLAKVTGKKGMVRLEKKELAERPKEGENILVLHLKLQQYLVNKI